MVFVTTMDYWKLYEEDEAYQMHISKIVQFFADLTEKHNFNLKVLILDNNDGLLLHELLLNGVDAIAIGTRDGLRKFQEKSISEIYEHHRLYYPFSFFDWHRETDYVIADDVFGGCTVDEFINQVYRITEKGVYVSVCKKEGETKRTFQSMFPNSCVEECNKRFYINWIIK